MLKLISKKMVLVLSAAAMALAGAGIAQADLITNGSFESYTNGKGGVQSRVATDAPSQQADTNNYSEVTGWSVANTALGYTFLFAPGSGDTTGSWNPQFGGSYLKFWGTNDGGPDVFVNSPDGGNFIAQDPGFQLAPLYQSISGLTVGQKYDVSFYYASAQQNNGGGTYSGDTTEGWNVSLGGQTLGTPVTTLTSHHFSGWTYTTLTFTADSTTDTLSFLAQGGPSGNPPFALLDGVTMNESVAPIPSSAWIAITGLVLVAGASKLNSRKSKSLKRAKLAL